MKLTKRPRGATVCQTGGAACAFAHRAFRSLSGCCAHTRTEARGQQGYPVLFGHDNPANGDTIGLLTSHGVLASAATAARPAEIGVIRPTLGLAIERLGGHGAI